MKQFFLRIFFSIWIILPITAVITVLTGKLFQLTGWFAPPTDFESALVEKVVNDIESMSDLPVQITVDRLLARHVLDMEQMMQIYVLLPSGQDVLQRELPRFISSHLNNNQVASSALDDFRMVGITRTSQGFTVIGHKAPYPLVRMIFQPKIRIVLWSVMILVSALVTWRLARYIVAPLRVLRQASVQVAKGNLDIRIANTVENRRDDIALLAQDFDVMTEKIELLISSQQRLMRDVSHELRSPLARLQAMISIASQQSDKQAVDLIRIEQELEKLDALIGDILSFSRIDTTQKLNVQRTDLRELIDVICEGAEIEAACEIERIDVSGPERLILEVDPKLIGSAIENIVRNALKFSPADQRISLSITRSRNTIEIAIVDKGPGVPIESLEHLFTPFYQVTSSNRGSGVGLSITRRAVELHGGSISAVNHAPHGLMVVISLPHRGAALET